MAGLYTELTNIPKQQLFFFLALALLVSGYVFWAIQPTFALVIALIAGMIVFYFLNDKQKTKLSSYNEELEYRLKVIRPQPQHFYTDPDVINIFYNIREFRVYNPDAYGKAVQAADIILGLHEDVNLGTKDCSWDIQEAKRQLKLCLNNLHSMIYKMPNAPRIYEKYRPDPVMKKYKDMLKTIHIVLRRHIDDMYNRCKKQVDSIPITKWTHFPDNQSPTGWNPDYININEDSHMAETHFNYF